jgi:hypothetical protein
LRWCISLGKPVGWFGLLVRVMIGHVPFKAEKSSVHKGNVVAFKFIDELDCMSYEVLWVVGERG